MRRIAVLALCWFTLTSGVFSGCNGLFTPAVPEPPTGNPIVANYRSPEAALQTMALGIAAKAEGRAAYLGAFADSTSPSDSAGYHQVFDPTVVDFWKQTSGRTPPSDWDFSLEQSFFLKFVATIYPGHEFIAIFELGDRPDPDPVPTEPNRVELYRRYTVFAVSPADNSTSIIAIGLANLTFRRFPGERWLITRWEDRLDPAVGAIPAEQDQLTLGRRRLDSQ